MKKLLLLILLPLLSYGQIQIGDDIEGLEIEDHFGYKVCLSSDGLLVAISAILNDENGDASGHVRIYENIDNSWIQIGQDINGEWIGDNSGEGLDLSADGNVVAIGSKFNDGNGEKSGHVRIYENINNDWIQRGEDIDGEAMYDESGNSVSLSEDGNIVAIGASRNNSGGGNSGHVRIYKYQDNNWIQMGDEIIGRGYFEYAGNNIDLSNDGHTIAVGSAIGTVIDDSYGSPVRIYKYENDNWIQLGEDIVDSNLASDEFGRSVSISSDGNIVAIGIPSHDMTKLYEYINSSWIQLGGNINGEFVNDYFGAAVEISGNGEVIIVGASRNDSYTGHARVFDLNTLLSNKEVNSNNFSLYPNPTKNNLTINLLNSDTLQKAVIYNSLGQEVLQSTQTNIDVSSLSKGVYIVEVQTSTGKGSEKLIIN